VVLVLRELSFENSESTSPQLFSSYWKPILSSSDIIGVSASVAF